MGQIIDGPGSNQSRSVATDEFGNIYVTGQYTDTTDVDPGLGTYLLPGTGGTNVFIVKIDALGDFIWGKNISAKRPL